MLSVSTFHLSSLKSSSHSTITRLNFTLPFSLSISPSSNCSSTTKPFIIHAIDEAHSFDYASKTVLQIHNSEKLKIAIIGFGNFGQFLAKTFIRQGHTVLAHSRSDYFTIAQTLGVHFFPNPHDLFEEHPEVILLCTSIISTQNVVHSLPFQRLKRSTLIVDVLSVKEFPKNLLLKTLPTDFDILCSHPMFGPESATKSWSGLTFVYEKVRIKNQEKRIARCEKFLDMFGREGCRMVEMSCDDHDRYTSKSQFITHTIGRVLDILMLESSPINTKGYESLLNLVENTCGDSYDLYYGLFMFNKNSTDVLERLDLAFEDLRKELVARLHDVVSSQLFEDVRKVQTLQRKGMTKYVPNGFAVLLSSKNQRYVHFL
ncbi:unnamed protein product [Lathyrus oleraceus]